jgi:hypothetical protein
MILTLILAAAVAVIWLAERSVEHLKLALAALCFIAAMLLFVVADLERAFLLATILTAAISAASYVKYNHSGLKLTVTDLPLAFAGTVPFFIAQYPLAVAAVIAGSILLVLAAFAVLLTMAGPPVSLEVQIILFGVTLSVWWRPTGAAAAPVRCNVLRRTGGVSFRASSPPCSIQTPGARSAGWC